MKVPETFNDRLYAAAERTKMPPAALALAAVEAALAAIERDEGIFMPVQMRVMKREEGGEAPPMEPDLLPQILEGKKIVSNLASLHAAIIAHDADRRSSSTATPHLPV